jgi:hypothetical protein
MTSETPDLVVPLNPQARMEMRRVGRESHPLLIIDQVLTDPQALIEVAKGAVYVKPDHTQYPGLNAPLPDAYARAIVPALRPMLQRGFGIPSHLPLTMFGFFALATAAPEDLQPIQKIPHHDSTDPFRIAMVHYLCHGKGGTGFFRHQATVDARRRADYVTAASAELDQIGDSLTRHVNAETPHHDLIESADLVFNRLIIYRSHVLHSGLLEEAALSSDPTTGRLTANSFIDVAKRPD